MMKEVIAKAAAFTSVLVLLLIVTLSPLYVTMGILNKYVNSTKTVQ
tara:strand:- start:468 stop:605 length:138 start_codon:yes stop_codon:yes gene_type:complete